MQLDIIDCHCDEPLSDKERMMLEILGKIVVNSGILAPHVTQLSVVEVLAFADELGDMMAANNPIDPEDVPVEWEGQLVNRHTAEGVTQITLPVGFYRGITGVKFSSI